ncbi:hypothetical protein L3Q82_016397 [Scortum barcoo]|uniref:Uncharacterized protein n=1 Tax=Scortum barcoo TaxID=214431 RepID=A0ACB8X795_9TELE|nr:hypothetical protein L3Q82_016397 [Scortum barcoo]
MAHGGLMSAPSWVGAAVHEGPQDCRDFYSWGLDGVRWAGPTGDSEVGSWSGVEIAEERRSTAGSLESLSEAGQERRMLGEYSRGQTAPCSDDPFPLPHHSAPAQTNRVSGFSPPLLRPLVLGGRGRMLTRVLGMSQAYTRRAPRSGVSAAAGPVAAPRAKACRAAAVSVPVHRGDGHDRGRVILTVLGSGGTMVRLRSSFFVNSTPLMSLGDITRSMKDLESDIVELEEMSESTGDRGCIEILKVKKLALANLLESKVQGALVRSLVSKHRRDGYSLWLLLRPGEEKRTEEEYEEDNTLQEEFCSGLPQVSTETNSRLAEPLRLCELQAALQSMQGQRAPGIDGLTSSLTLLPKKGNLQDIKNWRPVSLLCVDYKLLSKALANRLREAMEQVIHRDQTYCVPGRSMVDNVYLIRRCFGGAASYTGARLDISSSVAPGLTAALCRSRTLSLQQLVDAVGPALGDAEALSSLLSFHFGPGGRKDPQPLEAETLGKRRGAS